MVQGQSCLGIWGTVPNINVRTFRATVNSTSTSLGFLSYNNRTISYPYIDVNVGFSTILHAEALYVPIQHTIRIIAVQGIIFLLIMPKIIVLVHEWMVPI